MPAYNLLDLATVIRSFGRGAVFRAPKWDFASPLALTHLLDTEGDINVNVNSEVAGLTTPETTGPAWHEADYTGEAPVVEIPGYMTDPTTIALCSPSGTMSAGRSRRSAPLEHTLVLFPESVYLRDPDVNRIVEAGIVTYTNAGGWELDGEPLDAARLAALQAAAIWLWRGMFDRPPRRLLGGAGDARRNIETLSFRTMHHPLAPEGHHLYTIGNPADAGIDPEIGIVS
jgi:hypothetical protein